MAGFLLLCSQAGASEQQDTWVNIYEGQVAQVSPVSGDNKPLPPPSVGPRAIPVQEKPAGQMPVSTSVPGARSQENKPLSPARERPEEEQRPRTPEREQADSSRTDSNQSPSDTSEASAGFNPQIMGDLPGLFGLRTIFVPSVQTITSIQNITQQTTVFIRNPDTGQLIPVVVTTTRQVPVTIQVPVTTLETVRVLVASAGAFKIAENESPIPVDRVFLTYNFYDNVTGPAGPFSFPRTTTQTSIDAAGNPVVASTLFPGVAPPALDLHREVLGFEKTFLDQNASFGMRLPFFQQGDGSFGENDIGDLSLIFKYAFYYDKACGNVLSTGLVLTVPTGPDILTVDGNIHSVLFQPFIGYYWNLDRFYVQGFSSVTVPTDERDVTLLFNDIAVGYWLYRCPRGQVVTGIAPTLEMHVTTPLNHRGEFDPIVVPDLAVLTAGLHFGFSNHSSLTVGVATPLTGPRPYDVEAMAQLNWRF
jgi:hypothetical protein